MQYYVPRYSRKPSEAEIQADLYAAIKKLGLEPRLQVFGYLAPNAVFPKKKRCIFDIVVFWPLNHKPLCIIECKRGLSVKRGNKQIERYERFNLPVLVSLRNNSKEVMKAVRTLARNHFETDAPKSMKRQADWDDYIAELDSVE